MFVLMKMVDLLQMQTEQYNYKPMTEKIQTSGGAVTLVCSTGAWNHYVFAFDKGTGQATGYKNGVAGNSASSGAFAEQDSDEKIIIGNRADYSKPFNAQIDEIGFWKRKLTLSEIQDLYNGSATDGPIQPPVAGGEEDPCDCAGLNEDWELDFGDYCNITDDCDLGTGTLKFTGDTGYIKVNATIITTGMDEIDDKGILYIQNEGLIYIK